MGGSQETARRRPSSVFARICAIVATVLVAPVASGQMEYRGQPVVAVSFEVDAPFETSKLTDIVSVKPGVPLTHRDVQSSIKSLYSTGDFADIQVDASPAAGGVSIRFILSLNYRVREISFEGLTADRGRASREVLLREADVLSLNAIDRSAVALETFLRRRGFLEATVDPEVQFVREENVADVVFHVTQGVRATIGAIAIEGDVSPFSEAEILDAMSSKPGGEYRVDTARRDADRIRTFLIRREHRRADVRFMGETYDEATKQVSLRYRVDAGPRVRVEVVGVPRRAVRRWIPFDKNEAYSEDVIDRAADRIINEYQRRGHFLATVEHEERETEEELVVTFNVSPGRKYTLDDVLFEGNVKVSDRKLREVVSTGPPGGFRRLVAGIFRRPVGVTQEMLNDDRDALEAFYRLEGFTEASIEQPIARPQDNGELDVVFTIREGPQTIMSAVTIEGNEQIETRSLPRLQLEPNAPLNPMLVATDVVNLKTHYADRGYVEIQVAPQVTFSDDKTTATVAYRIAEGPKVLVDEVTVRGNTYTETDVVLRKAGLREGQAFSYLGMLEAQRNLYRLGIFQRVDILPEETGTGVGERDIVIQVEEGKNLTVVGAVGYSTDQGARGTLAVSHRNLFGTARYASIETRVSRRENRFVLTYREPFILGYDIPTQLTIFRGDELRTTIARIERIGTFIEASRIVREQTRWALRYEYRIVDVDCIDDAVCDRDGGIPIPGLPREDQEIEISSLTPTFFWDRRDDAINPSRGFFASAALEYAFPLYSAETNFLKGFSQGAWYRPLSARTLVAASARVGLIEPLTDRPPIPGDLPVPYSERFTGGGETSHRAFELDTLGILGETLICTAEDGICEDENDVVPIGGNALAIVNAELRFPLFGSLSGAVFTDAGNVWREIGDVDTADFRYGAGVGVRYMTPVGPLRVDIGFKLDRKDFEDPYALFITLGNPF